MLAADTIVVLPPPSLSILEKPRNEADQMGMLQDYNGSTVSVITAVTLGELGLLGDGPLVESSSPLRFACSPASDCSARILTC